MVVERRRVDFERFFTLSPELLCVVDPGSDARIVHVSDAWSTELGWSADELRGRPLLELVHADDADDTRLLVRGVSTGGQVAQLENRWLHRDGSHRHLTWKAWFDPAARLVYAAARDVTPGRCRGTAVHEAWMHMAPQESLTDLGVAISEQTRRLTRATGVLTTLAPGAAGPAGVHHSPAGFVPPVGAAASIRVDVGRTEHLGTIEAWLPDGVGEAERHRLVGLATELAELADLILGRFHADRAAARALARNLELLDSVSDAFFALDRDWRFSYLNAAAERALRRSSAELLGTVLWDEFPDARGTSFESCYRRAVDEGRPVTFTEYYRPLQGWFDVRAYPSQQGLAVYFVDVTERYQATRALERRAHQQRAAAGLGQRALSGMAVPELFRDAITEVHLAFDGSVVTVCELVSDGRWLEVWAETGPEAMARPRVGERHPPTFPDAAAVLGAVTGGEVAAVEGADEHGGHGQGPTALHIDAAVPIVAGGRVWGAVTVGTDGGGGVEGPDVAFLQQVANVLGAALDRQQVEALLRHQAGHDVLTRLPNRFLLRARIDDEVERAVLAGHQMALLLIDLDGFKDVNDHLGHAAGDTLLEQLASRLTGVVGDDGTVARLGGDEFAVCVSGPVTHHGVVSLAEKVLHAVERPVTLDGMEVTVSGSLGAVMAPTYGADSSTVLRHADVAMYRAKLSPGGSYVFYDPATDAARAERLGLITDLRSAVDSGQLELHYQPVIDMGTRRTVSVEALVRWRHPALGLLPPGTFIPLAEQAGLIGDLTRWVVQEAGDQARQWRREGLEIPIAVNISVRSLTDPTLAQEVVRLLVASADLLTVEVTESALMEERARTALDELAAAQVSCAVDDFGTGYSALAYLRSLPVSALKIDRAFITDLTDGSGVDLAIVRSVVDLAAALGLDVIAEGVETAAAEHSLLQAGVRLAQGFHYARPMPAPDLTRWLCPHGPAS